jgi:hypothetical protein
MTFMLQDWHSSEIKVVTELRAAYHVHGGDA